MKQRKRPVFFALAAGLLAILLALAVGANQPEARAPVGELYLELLVTKGGPPGYDIPPDCSVWREIHPNPGTLRHQSGFDDNSDGLLSPCDIIYLDQLPYHVKWVGPTYWVTRLQEPVALEPEVEPTGENPTCETWHEIYPFFCTPRHIDAWEDNQDGVLSVCDIVWMNEVPCHIDRIELNITAEPLPSGTEQESWGTIKSLFRRVYR
jgi:hypothetical protein